MDNKQSSVEMSDDKFKYRTADVTKRQTNSYGQWIKMVSKIGYTSTVLLKWLITQEKPLPVVR